MTTSISESSFDWEKYAECYDRLLHLRPYTSMLQEVVDHVKKNGHKKILDASCGTGNFEAVFFGTFTEHASITGIDFSREMLARAQRKMEPAGKVCSFLQTDLNARLPFDDNIFECVVSLNTLYALRDPYFTLSELRRTLKQGGQLFLVTPKTGFENGLILREHVCDNSSPEEWFDAHSSAQREEFLIRKALYGEEVIQDMLLVARYNRHIAKNQHFHFFDPEELRNLIEKSGFVIEHQALTYAKQDIFIVATMGELQ